MRFNPAPLPRDIMRKALALALCTAPTFTIVAQPNIAADASPPTVLEEVRIVGIREDRKSRGATGLDLSIWETPQSLTVIDAETIER